MHNNKTYYGAMKLKYTKRKLTFLISKVCGIIAITEAFYSPILIVQFSSTKYQIKKIFSLLL